MFIVVSLISGSVLLALVVVLKHIQSMKMRCRIEKI
jgi:hypothetical protein